MQHSGSFRPAPHFILSHIFEKILENLLSKILLAVYALLEIHIFNLYDVI